MNITRQANYIDGKWVYDPPLTEEEQAADIRRFAEMVRANKAPGAKGTDRAFLEGHHAHGFTDEPDWMRETILNKAKGAGIVVQGKKYVGGLADHRGPCDPRAWVSDAHEALKVCEERKLNAVGAVNYTAPPAAPTPDVPLAEMHIQGIDRDIARQDDKWLKKHPQERREAIIDTHGAPAKRRGKRRLVP